MAIFTDRDGLQQLKKVLSRRLKASRKAAGLSQSDAAEALNQKGITQVSLAEDGQRIPPILDLIKYADLYCVPIDFLIGRIDDPIADPDENRSGLMVRAVSHGIQECFSTFTQSVAEHVSVSLSGQREDRKDLITALRLAEEAAAALNRVKELNPEYEDLRGGSKLESTLKQMASLSANIEQRMKQEQLQFDMIDKALKIESIEERIEQFAMSF